jgi:hypothetical protein
MPPQLISLGIFALQQLITHEPEIAAAIKALFTKADPTPDDWNALHAKVALKSYSQYVPASRLPVLSAQESQTAQLSQVATAAKSAAEAVPIVVLPTPPVIPQANNPPAPAAPQSPAPVGLNGLTTALEASLTPAAK